jgi:hypothetical protein
MIEKLLDDNRMLKISPQKLNSCIPVVKTSLGAAPSSVFRRTPVSQRPKVKLEQL